MFGKRKQEERPKEYRLDLLGTCISIACVAYGMSVETAIQAAGKFDKVFGHREVTHDNSIELMDMFQSFLNSQNKRFPGDMGDIKFEDSQAKEIARIDGRTDNIIVRRIDGAAEFSAKTAAEAEAFMSGLEEGFKLGEEFRMLSIEEIQDIQNLIGKGHDQFAPTHPLSEAVQRLLKDREDLKKQVDRWMRSTSELAKMIMSTIDKFTEGSGMPNDF